MKQSGRRLCGSRLRGDGGLTTLEWLLITAAVAALAALAVVVVQAQIEDSTERVSSPDPRMTAAIHSAFEVEGDARAASAADFESWDGWERHFSRGCSLIEVLYADAEVEVVHNFHRATGGAVFDAAAAGFASAGDSRTATATRAQVQCEVR